MRYGVKLSPGAGPGAWTARTCKVGTPAPPPTPAAAPGAKMMDDTQYAVRDGFRPMRKSFRLVPGKNPSRDVGLTLRMQPIPASPGIQPIPTTPNPSCTQNVRGLFWVGDDGDETPTQIARAGRDLYSLYHPAQKFVFVARVTGEICEAKTTLTAVWDPSVDGSLPPKIWTNGPVMVVILVNESSDYMPQDDPENTYEYQNFGSNPGIVTVVGEVEGYGTVGPIRLIIQCTGPYCPI